MTYAFLERVKGIILDPVAAFQGSRDDTGNTVLVYFGILLIFLAGMSALMNALLITALSASGLFPELTASLGQSFMVLMPIITFFEILFFGLVFSILFALWVHLWVFILGGRAGIWQSLKAVLYGMTPALAFGWIPLVGILFAIWAFILDIIGLRELAGLSPARAFLAMLIAVLIPLVIGLLLVAYLFIPAVTSAMPMTPRMGY